MSKRTQPTPPPTRQGRRPLPKVRPAQARRSSSAPALTLGELIAAAFDVVGDHPAEVAQLLASRELRRRTNRRIAFV